MAGKLTKVVWVLVLIVFGNEVLELVGSDPATRLAYQLRNQSLLLRAEALAGRDTRTFEYDPSGWPDGVEGDYRVEISEAATSPGKRTIGVARGMTEDTWHHTSYHLNYVTVPGDLIASHRKGEPTVVKLVLRGGEVQIADLR